MRQWWTINIAGHGSFQFFGTPREADESGLQKLKRKSARITRCKATSAEKATGLHRLRWRESRSYPLDERQEEALKRA